jgi:thioredoxin 1
MEGIMPVTEITKATFDDVLLKNDTVLLDFWAPWCGPCRAFGPVFEKVSDKNPEMIFGKVNTENERDLAAQFGIMSIPTLMVFRQKIMVFRQSGSLPENAMDELIKKVKELDMDKVRADMAKDQ